MTYIPDKGGTLCMTEFTAQSQTANNSILLWNTTGRGTGTTGVSIDSSGNITLTGGAAYWLILSMDAIRSGDSQDVMMGFYDETGTEIEQDRGVSPLRFNVWDAPTPNSVGFMAADCLTDRIVYIKYQGTTNVSISVTMTLLVLEAQS